MNIKVEEFRLEMIDLKMKLFPRFPHGGMDFTQIPDSYDSRRLRQLLGFFNAKYLRYPRWVCPLDINVRDLPEDYIVLKGKETQLSLDWVKGFNEFEK